MRSNITKADLEAEYLEDLEEYDNLAVDADISDDVEPFDPKKDEEEDFMDWQDVY